MKWASSIQWAEVCLFSKITSTAYLLSWIDSTNCKLNFMQGTISDQEEFQEYLESNGLSEPMRKMRTPQTKLWFWQSKTIRVIFDCKMCYMYEVVQFNDLRKRAKWIFNYAAQPKFSPYKSPGSDDILPRFLKHQGNLPKDESHSSFPIYLPTR